MADKKYLTPKQLRLVAADMLDWLETHDDPEIPTRDAVVILAMCIAALTNMMAHKTGNEAKRGGDLACQMIMKLIDDWKDHKPRETA